MKRKSLRKGVFPGEKPLDEALLDEESTKTTLNIVETEIETETELLSTLSQLTPNWDVEVESLGLVENQTQTQKEQSEEQPPNDQEQQGEGETVLQFQNQSTAGEQQQILIFEFIDENQEQSTTATQLFDEKHQDLIHNFGIPCPYVKKKRGRGRPKNPCNINTRSELTHPQPQRVVPYRSSYKHNKTLEPVSKSARRELSKRKKELVEEYLKIELPKRFCGEPKEDFKVDRLFNQNQSGQEQQQEVNNEVHFIHQDPQQQQQQQQAETTSTSTEMYNIQYDPNSSEVDNIVNVVQDFVNGQSNPPNPVPASDGEVNQNQNQTQDTADDQQIQNNEQGQEQQQVQLLVDGMLVENVANYEFVEESPINQSSHQEQQQEQQQPNGYTTRSTKQTTSYNSSTKRTAECLPERTVKEKSHKVTYYSRKGGSGAGRFSHFHIDCDDTGKPKCTYTDLIEKALQEREGLTVSEIYNWISTNYPYFKPGDDRWKNSVRHNLSINPYFKKGKKSKNGAGHTWSISEDCRNNSNGNESEIDSNLTRHENIDEICSSTTYHLAQTRVNSFENETEKAIAHILNDFKMARAKERQREQRQDRIAEQKRPLEVETQQIQHHYQLEIPNNNDESIGENIEIFNLELPPMSNGAYTFDGNEITGATMIDLNLNDLTNSSGNGRIILIDDSNKENMGREVPMEECIEPSHEFTILQEACSWSEVVNNENHCQNNGSETQYTLSDSQLCQEVNMDDHQDLLILQSISSDTTLNEGGNNNDDVEMTDLNADNLFSTKELGMVYEALENKTLA